MVRRLFASDLFSGWGIRTLSTNNPAYQPLALEPHHVFEADDLRFTRDPFDALIVAAARDLSLPLITRDAAIAGSGVVKVLW